MSWLRLTLETTAEHVDAMTELLEQFQAGAVSYQAASDEQLFAGIAEAPRLWQKTVVSALLDTDLDMDILLACLRNKVGTQAIHSHRIEMVKDREWEESHKQGVKPRVFAGRLCVCPSWVEVGDRYEATIVLDPGLAFGTGDHPTTALCLDWLARNDVQDKRIIDYGCGSGILALAAASLGAETVHAVDIDPQALKATSDNAEKNKLAHKLKVTGIDGTDLPKADLLLANILLNPLLELAPRFRFLLKPDGIIVLSGILSTQADECLAAYEPWFKIGGYEYKDEWALLHGRLA